MEPANKSNIDSVNFTDVPMTTDALPADKSNIDLVNFMDVLMTTDAFFIIISGLLLVLVLVYKYGLNIMFILLMFSYIVTAYQVNCMIIGSCHFYAKLISITTLVSVILIINDKNLLKLFKDSLIGNQNQNQKQNQKQKQK